MGELTEKLENGFKKIESTLDDFADKFEKNPLKTGFKILMIYVILKWVWKQVK